MMPHLTVAEAGAAGGKDEEVHGLDSQVGPEGDLGAQAAQEHQPGAAGCRSSKGTSPGQHSDGGHSKEWHAGALAINTAAVHCHTGVATHQPTT